MYKAAGIGGHNKRFCVVRGRRHEEYEVPECVYTAGGELIKETHGWAPTSH